MYGQTAARLLSAVSGGSYTAAASTLQAAEMGRLGAEGELWAYSSAPPLASGAPETEHILTHGRYLFRGGPVATVGLYLLLLGINLAVFPSVFLFYGGALGMIPLDFGIFGLDVVPPDRHTWVILALFFAAAWVSLKGVYRDGGPWRYLLMLVGFPVFVVTASTFVAVVLRHSWLTDLWTNPAVLWPSLAAAVSLAGLAATSRLSRSEPGRFGSVRWISGQIVAWWARWIAFIVFCVSVRFGYTWISERGSDPTAIELAIPAVFCAVVVVSRLTARASLHRANRARIASAFHVLRRRTALGGVDVLPATTTRLSSLAPPRPGSEYGFPRLVICATMNIRRFRGRWTSFEPFHFSSDVCGPPDYPDVPPAHLATEGLESGRRRAGLFPPWSTEPVVSLMSAVACTGAAASPAAGKYTGAFPGWRIIFTFLNVRLGAWVPNPLSAIARGRVNAQPAKSWKLDRPRGLAPGFDEFIPEMFGLHSPRAARAYLSDGGHYDNLGLLALFREQCEEIWCVDSEADREGAAHQVRDILALAERELGVTVDINLDQLAGGEGVLGATFAIGEIHYEPRFSEPVLGKLVVIKLGLSRTSSLKDYQTRDRHSPFHSTAVVGFGPDRMRAYVDLGRENTEAAFAAMAAAKNSDD